MALTTVNPLLLDTQAQYTGFKNRIINGSMTIDQRNAGASVTPASGQSTYIVDRWRAYVSQASKLTVQQNAGSVTPPTGFINYSGITSSSAYSIISSDIFTYNQVIEGYNIADLAWGTANAVSVTLSFWVRSSLTGTFGGSVCAGGGGYSYPFTYTISSANTWTQISIAIPGATSGTWATNNTPGLVLFFGLGVGSTGSGTAGVWAASTYYSATGATSVVGTNGATFYITGVQLEKGTQATSFDYRPYGTELMLCQRYYEVGLDRNAIMWAGYIVSAGQTPYANKGFSVVKRGTPICVYSNEVLSGFASGAPSSFVDTTGMQISRTSNAAVTNGYFFYNWTASAEL